MEMTNQTMSTTRKLLTVAFTTAALAASFLAAMSSANATYYCHWTAARGTVCTWVP
jgi:hypothetical protein